MSEEGGTIGITNGDETVERARGGGLGTINIIKETDEEGEGRKGDPVAVNGGYQRGKKFRRKHREPGLEQVGLDVKLGKRIGDDMDIDATNDVKKIRTINEMGKGEEQREGVSYTDNMGRFKTTDISVGLPEQPR